ncbi:MAG: DUF1616 domain-containing protein [Methanothrix sp.]|nr:DUF1616 domain-containing protein [Methanothrix sp.]
MRLAWPPPRHLIASVLISVLALALVHLPPPSLQETLSLPALILVLLIPGYLATLSLFPGKSDLSGQRRAFLCLVFSAMLAGLFSFILSATPRGLQSASLATLLSLLAIFLAAVAYGRWSNLPRKRRFLLLPKRGMRYARGFPRISGASIRGRRAALVIVLLAACLIAALAIAFGPYHFPSDEPFTELGATIPGEALSPQSLNNSAESSRPSPAANFMGINATENNSPVILEEKSKVIVLNAGGGGMDGGMGGGSSESRSQTAAKKPDSQTALQPEKTASSVAGKNVSSLSITSSKENQTGKDNLTLKNNLTHFASNVSSASNASLPSEKTPSLQASAAPVTAPSPDTNRSLKLVASMGPIKSNESSSSAASDINAAADNSTGKISAKNESNLSNSNQPPVLVALVPDRASPQQQGAAIFWKAEATDEEGDKILYKFLLDGQEVRKWSKTNSWSWLSQGLSAGDYQITVLTIDGKHASLDSFDSRMNASFTLNRPNQAPVLQQLKSDNASPHSIGGRITWTASATDPDNDQISYKFMKNDEDVTGWSTSNSWIWDTSSEKPGDYRIAVLAKDGLHALKDAFDSTLDSSFVLTSPNSIPEVTALKADRPSPQANGGVITWTAIAVDPDGDEISYKFLANDKEVREWSSSNYWVWNTSSAAPGEYRIKVLARDGKHAQEDSFDSSKDAVITITIADSNQPPALLALVPDIASPEVQGATVIWKAEAQDPEGDKILYKFQLNGRDMSRWSELSSWKWSSKDLAAGDYKIRVLARDGKHASEDSFDSSKDAVFSLISEIDQQIDQLMKKRSSTKSNEILGKSNSTGEQEKTVTPRKLGG